MAPTTRTKSRAQALANAASGASGNTEVDSGPALPPEAGENNLAPSTEAMVSVAAPLSSPDELPGKRCCWISVEFHVWKVVWF